jgi:glyceraldehyde 3-phosphate dehydrogenase
MGYAARIFREEAHNERYRDVLGASDEPLVSADIVQDPRASIVNLEMTQVGRWRPGKGHELV